MGIAGTIERGSPPMVGGDRQLTAERACGQAARLFNIVLLPDKTKHVIYTA